MTQEEFDRIPIEEHRAEHWRRIQPGIEALPEWLLPACAESVGLGYWLDPATGEPRYGGEDDLAACKQAIAFGCKSPLDLIGMAVSDDFELRVSAYRLIGSLKVRKAAPTLLLQFERFDRDRWEIAKFIPSLESRRARTTLVDWMLTHPDADLREVAAYALTYDGDAALAEPHLQALSNEAEDDRVRLQALEALGHYLYCKDQRSAYYRRYSDAILPYLPHSDPAYRFWAAFSLGQAGCKKAVPVLKELAATDHAECPGWWSVSREAQDALDSIQKRRPC